MIRRGIVLFDDIIHDFVPGLLRVAVEVETRAGSITLDTDEQPGQAKRDRIPHLKPAFAPDGTITPASLASISDGAAAFVVTRESMAR